MALFRLPFPFQIVVAACQRRVSALGCSPTKPPPMTVDERMAAARRRRKDPPLCHYGVRATLVVPPRGGSPSIWPSDEEVRAYEADQAP
ncbi:hypothetical protein HU200_058815 [Digitaria exilis]|uniref:Uncharacterized protein n=1 Tax=Digitaria exilis TaxID=1010633 RepID=A0A835E076_9POAL|nr:hypothetical protein HU200_058815 [Digitaria exilis]